MKKNIALIIAGVICITGVSVISYKCGQKNALEKIIMDDAVVSETINKIDYPLIDIAFNDGNEYAVLIVDGIYSDKRTYRLCRDRKELQNDKEFLSILTYPAGRGTTGNGCVVVYQNGKEIRNIEYFDIVFKNEELKNKFEDVSKKDVEKFLNSIK